MLYIRLCPCLFNFVLFFRQMFNGTCCLVYLHHIVINFAYLITYLKNLSQLNVFGLFRLFKMFVGGVKLNVGRIKTVFARSDNSSLCQRTNSDLFLFRII